MNDNEKALIEKALNDLKQRIDERIDTLCAIYECDGLRHMVGSLITLDGAFDVHTKMLLMRVEDAEEATAISGFLIRIQPHTFAVLTRNMMDMLDIPEDRRRQLMDDVMGIVRVRKQCEAEISAALGDEN